MKAVILESYVMEEGDLDWSGVKALIPDTTSYVRTAYEEIAPRIGGAEVVFLNKCRMDEAVLAQCPNLKFVGIIATGTDNLDLEACRRHGVAVANVPELLDLQRRPDDLQSAPRHLPVRRAVRSRRQGRLLAVGYPGKLWAAAPSGAVRQDLRRLRLRQHRPPDRPHRQGLRDAGPRLHPHRPAGVFRRRRGVRGV